MTSEQSSQGTLLRFELTALDRGRSEESLRGALSEAISEVQHELELPEKSLESELEGGFLGIGTITVVLVIKKVALAAVLGAASGLGKKASEFLFDEYLAPKLRRRNLIPNPPTIEKEAREDL